MKMYLGRIVLLSAFGSIGFVQPNFALTESSPVATEATARPRGLLKHYIRAKSFSNQIKQFLKAHGREITAVVAGTALGALGTGFVLKQLHEQKMDAVRDVYAKQEEEIVDRYENDKKAVAEERQRAWEARESELVALKNYLTATFDSNVKAAREEFDRRRVEMIDSVNRTLVESAQKQQVALESGVEQFNTSGREMLGETQAMIKEALLAQQDKLIELQELFKAQEKVLLAQSEAQFNKMRADYDLAVEAQKQNHAILGASLQNLSAEHHRELLNRIKDEQDDLKEDFEKQQALLRAQVKEQQEQLQLEQEQKSEAFVTNALDMMRGVSKSATDLHEATAYYAGMAGQAAYGAAAHAASAYQQMQGMGAQQAQFTQELQKQYQQHAQQQSKEYRTALSRQEDALRKQLSSISPVAASAMRAETPAARRAMTEDEAALKIQAAFRGMKGRNVVRTMRGQPLPMMKSTGHSELPSFKKAAPVIPQAEIDRAMSGAVLAATKHTIDKAFNPAQQQELLTLATKWKEKRASVPSVVRTRNTLPTLIGPENRPAQLGY
ncbi:MAG: hypothetical protein QG632_649 [Candidatus Dependentiae bacterium]|nr:hypothetical protein [Candidatus Dependentiae bacterium]